MRALVWAVVGVLCLAGFSVAKKADPKVQVYSRYPKDSGKANTFICHVSGFHPPEIYIELLKNGKAIPNSNQTDLAFDDTWHYHLTRHASFAPNNRDKFACNVTHVGVSKMYDWDPDM